jgi:hypothetical protein
VKYSTRVTSVDSQWLSQFMVPGEHGQVNGMQQELVIMLVFDQILDQNSAQRYLGSYERLNPISRFLDFVRFSWKVVHVPSAPDRHAHFPEPEKIYSRMWEHLFANHRLTLRQGPSGVSRQWPVKPTGPLSGSLNLGGLTASLYRSLTTEYR